MKGFEIIESGRQAPAKTNDSSVTISNVSTPTKVPSTIDKTIDIVSNNFDNMMNLAGSIIEIQKMKVVSEACLKKMAEDRKMLEAEARAYVEKKRADTSSIVDKMTVIRDMMQIFYAQSHGSMSGADFCKVITEIISKWDD